MHTWCILFLTATLDNQTLNSTVTFAAGTDGSSNSALALIQTEKNIAMQKNRSTSKLSYSDLIIGSGRFNRC